MSGPNDILTKTFVAESAVSKNKVVKFGAADDNVAHATAATDLAIGVALHDAAIGERVDVQVMGLAEAKAAGTIARGAFCSPTTGGDVVALAAAATIKVGAGRAMASAVSGDVFPMLITHFEAVTA